MKCSFPTRTGGFSLVVTLIIVSMLAVVAIGFLSSMSSERINADAFGNKTRAEQAAQAGADSAMAILRQAFKDFPDSATVWENHSVNTPTKFDISTPSPYNEGTSLYVRAMADASSTLPDPTVDNRPDHPLDAGQTDPHVTDQYGADARTMFVLPLISGATYKSVASKDKAVNDGNPFKKDQHSELDNFVDLNVLRYKGDSQGWIGSPPANTPTATPAAVLPPKTTRVPWVEVKQADATDPTKAPVVARYAFWVEDESFRANVNYGGTGNDGADPTGRRADNSASFNPPTSSPAPTPDRALSASNVDLYFPLHLLSDADALGHASALVKTRALYPAGLFPESLGFSHTGDGAEFTAAERLNSTTADRLRYLTTTTSAGLNLSRHGSQRLSLNRLIYPQNGPTYTPQQQIDALIKTIQFHAPNFGQRFYRFTPTWPGTLYTTAPYATLNELAVKGDADPNSVLHDHKLIYLNRVAANILDFMDADSQPTFIDQTGKVITGIFQGLEGFDRVNNASPIWANGKEGIPYMDECAARFRLGAYDPAVSTRYRLYVDYYIELWNMTGRDVTLGPGARIRISQPPPWVGNATSTGASNQDTYMPDDETDGVSPSSSREFPDLQGNTDPKRDYDIDISGLTFKAGRASIITTDPDWKDIITNWQSYNDNIASVETPPNIFLCGFISPGKRAYSGIIPFLKGSTTTRCKVIHIPPGATYSNTSSSDYKTSVVIYNKDNQSYLDLLEGAVPMANSGAFSISFPTNVNATAASLTPGYKLYGGSLRGNTTAAFPSLSGDPRTNNEQMDYVLYLSGGPSDQSRYFNFTYASNSGSSGAGVDASLGTPNANFCKPDDYTVSGVTPWPDFIDFKLTPQNAVNAPMVMANAPLTSIGQLGDVFDPARWVPTRDSATVNAARGGGRTFKIGQHDDHWDGDVMSASHSWASWRLVDFFCTDDSLLQPGLININGVARDNGAALRAALTGFKFQLNAPNGRGAPKLESATALNVEPGPSPALGATPMPGLDNVVNQIKKRLLQPAAGESKYGIAGYEPLNSGRGPFFERGELSELPAFGRNTIPFPPSPYKATDLAGIDLGQVMDRGREEFFRRLVEMTTTRGDIFTVYAMGQSIVERPSPDPTKPYKHPTSTQRMKVTFRLVPKMKSTAGTTSTTAPDFHPATDASGATKPFDGTNRFVRPDHYDIEILSSSKGGG